MIPNRNSVTKTPDGGLAGSLSFAKSRAHWLLGARDGIDERLAGAWPGRAIRRSGHLRAADSKDRQTMAVKWGAPHHL